MQQRCSCVGHLTDLGRVWGPCATNNGHGADDALQRAAAAEDPYFQECLFGTLLEARAITHLLGMDSPLLERYLRTTGGLGAERGVPFQPGSPIGPLSPTQVCFRP